MYHYIPALMVGVLLASFAMEGMWALAARAPRGRVALARAAAGLVSAACFGLVAAAFWYWCIPFGYGERLDWNVAQARKWNSKW